MIFIFTQWRLTKFARQSRLTSHWAVSVNGSKLFICIKNPRQLVITAIFVHTFVLLGLYTYNLHVFHLFSIACIYCWIVYWFTRFFFSFIYNISRSKYTVRFIFKNISNKRQQQNYNQPQFTKNLTNSTFFSQTQFTIFFILINFLYFSPIQFFSIFIQANFFKW